MFRREISFFAINFLILGAVWLIFPLLANAQRHGGHGLPGGGLSGISRPDGVDEKDDMKDFHQALALQATSQQVSEFQALVKSTETARADLQKFLATLRQGTGAASFTRPDGLDPAIEKVRNGTKAFQEGFSPAQKNGMKEDAKRLAKADSELEQADKELDQTLDIKAAGSALTAHAESLDKSLAEYSAQQLALGRAMSITLANAQDVAFTLPLVKGQATIQGRTIGVPVSGMLAQTAVSKGQRTFKLDLTVDLSELQDNFTSLLRSQIESNDTCGQRIALLETSLTPATPAGQVRVRMHFERWICSRSTGQALTSELADSDGTVELKLTTAVDSSNRLKIDTAIGRIDASGMLEEALRSGALGDDLRAAVSQSVLSAVLAGSDLKIVLPAALQNSAANLKARFQELGVGGLSVVLAGEIEISDAQADQLANQLNQTLSAQGAAAQ
jgi:hypothetical protein